MDYSIKNRPPKKAPFPPARPTPQIEATAEPRTSGRQSPDHGPMVGIPSMLAIDCPT
jgi:hypothetical protein